MRIIVTGGAGYIGSHTCVELLAQGHDICVIDSFVNAQKSVMQTIEFISGRPILWRHCDIRDLASLCAIFDDYRPQAVLHFAGLKSVAESVANPLRYYDVNVAGTHAVLHAMERTGCQSIIYSSSATVYGTPHYLPYDEDHPTAPINPYGRSKLMAEEMLRDWGASNPDHQAICLRYFNPVGAHPSALLGENPKGIPENLMPYISQVAMGKRPKLMIYGGDYDTKDGTGERDYIHVCDLAKAHVKALEYQNDLHPFEALNIGQGSSVSVLEMLHAFEHAAGKSIPHEITQRRDGDLPRYWAQTQRADERIGFQTKYDLNDMCRDTWRWIVTQKQSNNDC